MCIMLDGRALASVRVARGLESVLGVGSEFVVLVLSVVRHVDINLARYATRGVVSSARTSAHRSAKETRHTVSEGWSTKNVFGRLGSLHKSPAQEGRTPRYTYLTLQPNVHACMVGHTVCTVQLYIRCEVRTPTRHTARA